MRKEKQMRDYQPPECLGGELRFKDLEPTRSLEVDLKTHFITLDLKDERLVITIEPRKEGFPPSSPFVFQPIRQRGDPSEASRRPGDRFGDDKSLADCQKKLHDD
jgi:hypothetical protein